MSEACLFVTHFGTEKGYEEIKSYLKKGNDFCSDLASIFQKRYEAEITYSKSLLSIQQKLQEKCNREGTNSTLLNTWISAAKVMESEANVHKQLSESLMEYVVKPLNNLSDNFLRNRKPVESSIDKCYRSLQDKREEENKAKKKAFGLCKDIAKAQQAAESDPKNQKKCRSIGELCSKADKEYFDSSLKAERCRLNWHQNLLKGLKQLQRFEEDRMNQVFEVSKKYHFHLSHIAPALATACDQHQESILSVDIDKDLTTIAAQGESYQEQLLFELPALDLTIPIDLNFRQKTLLDYKSIIETQIQTEKNNKDGCEKMMTAYSSQSEFSSESTLIQAREQFNFTVSLLNYYNAINHRIRSALSQIDNSQAAPRNHKLSKLIEESRDSQKLPKSILKLPLINSVNGTIASTPAPNPPQSADFTYNNNNNNNNNNNRSSSIRDSHPLPPVPPSQQRGVIKSSTASTTPRPTLDDVYTVYYSSDEFDDF